MFSDAQYSIYYQLNYVLQKIKILFIDTNKRIPIQDIVKVANGFRLE